MRLDAKFELVDTPGLDAFGLDHHEELTLRRFLPEADIVIYMTAIRNPLKKADLRVLNEIVQHDQRVIFVQTGIDLEVDSTERGRIIESREEKLEKHIGRLKNDVQKHAPHLKAWHYAQVSSKWAKSRWRYSDSGFDPLLQSIEKFSKDLIPLIARTVLRETSGLLKGTLKTIEQRILELQGDEVRAKDKKAERKRELNLLQRCLSSLNGILEQEERSWGRSVSPGNLAEEIRNQLSPHLSEETFQEKWNDCVSRLQGMMRPFLKSLDKAEENCRTELAKVEIQVSRSTDASLSAPQTSLNLSWKWTTETVYERRWYTLWLYRHEKEVKRKVLDLEKSRDDLSRYAQNVGNELTNHFGWWKDKRIQERYIAPVQKRLEQLEKMYTAMANVSLHELGDLLRTKESLTPIMEQMLGFRIADHSENPPTSHGVMENKIRRSPDICHPLIRLAICYRELRFHRQLLTVLQELNGSLKRPVLVCLGIKKDDGKKLVSLLRHDLQSVNHFEFGSAVSLFRSPDSGTEFPEKFDSKCRVTSEDLSIWRHVTCVIPQSMSENISESNWNELLAGADAVAVFVNLSQIGSGLNDLHFSPWSKILPMFREKTFYICLEMALFSTKPHELVTQVIPKLWQESPCGKRPLFLSEDYDVRYTSFAQFGLGLRETVSPLDRPARRALVRRTVQQWQEQRIPMNPPFTRKYLQAAFLGIASEMET